MAKIIIIHGNGITAQTAKVLEIKKGFDPLSVQEINGRNFSWSDTILELSTPQLFSKERLVILEEFGDKEIDLSLLPKDGDLTLILRFLQPLTASSPFIKKAQSLKLAVLAFNENDEKAVFPFLDQLAAKDQRALLSLDKLLAEYGGQYLLTMLFYLFRRMLIKPGGNLPAFVVKKIVAQSKNFSLDKLRELLKVALETDFKIKTGLVEEKLGMTLLVEQILR